MKRGLLFLGTNMAILLVLSVSMRVLGVEPYLTANGLNLGSLLIFAAVMGFGGAFISLAISKWSAKRAKGVQVIETVFQLARLSAKFFQRQLQFAALVREAVQLALSDGNVALHFLELVGRAGALVFGRCHFLAQGIDLLAQFLEIGTFFRNVGLAWSSGFFLGCRSGRGDEAGATQRDSQP